MLRRPIEPCSSKTSSVVSRVQRRFACFQRVMLLSFSNRGFRIVMYEEQSTSHLCVLLLSLGPPAPVLPPGHDAFLREPAPPPTSDVPVVGPLPRQLAQQPEKLGHGLLVCRSDKLSDPKSS